MLKRKALLSLALGTALVLAQSIAGMAQTDSRFSVTKGAGSFKGTVLFTLNSSGVDSQGKAIPTKIIEVNSNGEVVWEKTCDGAMDVTKLDNNDILVAQLGTGVTELNQKGDVVWQWKGAVSHHADLLPNGNILTVSTPENWVREIDFDGKVVWEWKTSDHVKDYTPENYVGVTKFSPDKGFHNPLAVHRENNALEANDWTHVNSAQRLSNGNTLIGLRNFDLVVEVNKQGDVVWSYGPLVIKHAHSVQILPNGHLMLVDNGNARIIEVDRATQQIVWEYKDGLNLYNQGHSQRLEDGNTLITDSNNKRIILVSPKKEILWEMKVVASNAKALYRAKYYGSAKTK